MGLSKNQLKIIKQLSSKKYRLKYGLFMVEGVKVVAEFLASNFKLKHLFYTEENAYPEIIEKTFITEAELSKISNLKSPNRVVALFEIPTPSLLKNKGLVVALDAVNDPGNLGTIIRLCDWFGIDQLICSETTVDCFNPKVVQASMGSLTRLSIVYTDLLKFLKKAELPQFIADMEGKSVYKTKLPQEAILVMGNEANGVSKEVKNVVKNKISIPQFGKVQETESLNVATATAILLSEFKRN